MTLSPPSMFCVMTFDYLGLDYKNYEVDGFRNEHKKEWYLKVNPNGAVPALKDVNGFTTNEGIAIVRYAAVYPLKDKKKLAVINDTLEFIVEEVRNKCLVCAQVVVMNPTFFGAERQSQEFNNQLISAAHAGYSKMDAKLQKHGGDYILGDQITICDFYMSVWIILLVETRTTNIDQHATLSAWFDRMCQIPQVNKARTKYRKMFKMGLFMVTWILPIMKCCTCQCCCSKKKK